MRKKVPCIFVELQKAYGKVNRPELWNVLHEYGTKGWMLNVVSVVYKGSKAGMRMKGMLSDIEQGIRQSCVISLSFFNVFVDKWKASLV